MMCKIPTTGLTRSYRKKQCYPAAGIGESAEWIWRPRPPQGRGHHRAAVGPGGRRGPRRRSWRRSAPGKPRQASQAVEPEHCRMGWGTALACLSFRASSSLALRAWIDCREARQSSWRSQHGHTRSQEVLAGGESSISPKDSALNTEDRFELAAFQRRLAVSKQSPHITPHADPKTVPWK